MFLLNYFMNQGSYVPEPAYHQPPPRRSARSYAPPRGPIVDERSILQALARSFLIFICVLSGLFFMQILAAPDRLPDRAQRLIQPILPFVRQIRRALGFSSMPTTSYEKKEARRQEVSKLPIEKFASEEDLHKWSAGSLKDELRRLQVLSEMNFGRYSGGTATRATHHLLRAGGVVEKSELVHAVLQARGGDSGLSCAVCLSSYTSGEEVRVLPCGHRFHCSCVDTWLIDRQQRSCPLCTAKV